MDLGPVDTTLLLALYALTHPDATPEDETAVPIITLSEYSGISRTTLRRRARALAERGLVCYADGRGVAPNPGDAGFRRLLALLSDGEE